MRCRYDAPLRNQICPAGSAPTEAGGGDSQYAWPTAFSTTAEKENS